MSYSRRANFFFAYEKQNFFSETRFFGYDKESKEYNAESHRDRILGKHVADYMKSLKEGDEEAYKRQFSRYIKEGITPESVNLIY